MSSQATEPAHLARRLGVFSAAMIVMGGIIGVGIFKNPYVVASRVHTTPLILGCWLLGGLVAIAGAFVYAELAARRPQLVGGQYAYLRDAYHPMVGFMYGWALLLVIQTGGMAAVSVIFAQYFLEITHLPVPELQYTLPFVLPFRTDPNTITISREAIVAAPMLLLLTVINCLGVEAGALVQNVLMSIKILVIAALVLCALLLVGMPQLSFSPALDQPLLSLPATIAAGMGPVMFAYGGWHTASFVAAEMRDPKRDLARGLLIGVTGVVLIYLAVNLICVGALGAKDLAKAEAPASAVMRLAVGERGARLIAVGIAISAFGFLSQSMLTAPRVYFAMADDRLFFKRVAQVSPLTKVPVIAIALQGFLAAVIALSGTFEQILNYVVSVDFIAYGLTATCLFVFRYRDKSASPSAYQVPGHPATTLFFVVVCWAVVAGTIYSHPRNSLVGLVIVLAGIPVYFLWRWWRREQ